MLGTSIGKKVDANFVRKGYQEFLTKTNKSTIQRAALQPKPMSKAQKREEMRKRGIYVEADNSENDYSFMEKTNTMQRPYVSRLRVSKLRWKKSENKSEIDTAKRTRRRKRTKAKEKRRRSSTASEKSQRQTTSSTGQPSRLERETAASKMEPPTVMTTTEEAPLSVMNAPNLARSEEVGASSAMLPPTVVKPPQEVPPSSIRNAPELPYPGGATSSAMLPPSLANATLEEGPPSIKNSSQLPHPKGESSIMQTPSMAMDPIDRARSSTTASLLPSEDVTQGSERGDVGNLTQGQLTQDNNRLSRRKRSKFSSRIPSNETALSEMAEKILADVTQDSKEIVKEPEGVSGENEQIEKQRKRTEEKILEDVTQDSKEIIKEHEGTSGENEQIGPQPKRSEEGAKRDGPEFTAPKKPSPKSKPKKTAGSSSEKDQREQLKIDFGISTNSRETDCSFPQEMASASALSTPSDDLRSTRDDVFSALEEDVDLTKCLGDFDTESVEGVGASDKKTLEAAKKILRISHKEKAIEKTLTKEENEIISKFFSGKIPYDQTVLNVLDRVLDKTIDYLQTHGTTLDPETKRLVEKRKKLKAAMLETMLTTPKFIPSTWVQHYDRLHKQAMQETTGINWAKVLLFYPRQRSFDDGEADICCILGPNDSKSFEETEREKQSKSLFMDTSIMEHAKNDGPLTSAGTSTGSPSSRRNELISLKTT
ncbi:hypothetical protein RB195_004878 [Necator americanus]|uniref:DUF7774 domain-containing protein n=1 Tax=Necator americanus TaxID=51031 RepID=A0ABR1BNG0_NECAM